MRQLSSFVICFLFVSCSNKNMNDKKEFEDSVTHVNKMQSIKQAQTLQLDTILKDDNVIVLGDSSNNVKGAINYLSIRFKPRIKFSDFKVDVGSNPKIPIQYSSNKIARMFKTVITETCKKEGLNFAGHYCFVQWGCGSPCQMSAVVDMQTGIVYEGETASLGYEFKKDSRMLIVNPPDSTGFYLNCGYCEPLIYIWNEKQKKFEQR